MSWDFFIISGDIGEGNASTFTTELPCEAPPCDEAQSG
jgi:hypothetical protein